MKKNTTLKLRIKFDKVVQKSVEAITENCKTLKLQVEPEYRINISDHSIRFCIGILQREKFSPNLKITLEEMEDGNTYIKGTYGPDPVLWVAFVFVHFIIATVFVLFTAIIFSKWSLNQSFTFDAFVLASMLLIWVALYLFARLNRKKGWSQMKELEKLYLQVIQ